MMNQTLTANFQALAGNSQKGQQDQQYKEDGPDNVEPLFSALSQWLLFQIPIEEWSRHGCKF